MSYDPQNIFAKILLGEIPCKKILENQWGLAFHDIHPRAPIHALVIPKGPYINSADFFEKASDEEIAGFYRLLGEVVRTLELTQPGFRLLSNCGVNGGQEVPHFHVHIFGGRALGPMLVEKG